MNSKKRGFIAMTTALVISVFLFLISAAIMGYANQALRTEAWMSERAQRSLYPLAWSTAHFVLDTISGDLGTDKKLKPTTDNVFASGDSIYSGNILFDVLVDGISVDVDITINGDPTDNRADVAVSPIVVRVRATGAGGLESEVIGQIVSDDAKPRSIDIIWR